jgi:hypothetical protein
VRAPFGYATDIVQLYPPVDNLYKAQYASRGRDTKPLPCGRCQPLGDARVRPRRVGDVAFREQLERPGVLVARPVRPARPLSDELDAHPDGGCEVDLSPTHASEPVGEEPGPGGRAFGFGCAWHVAAL